MDLVILLGAGLLGAVFVLSENGGQTVSILWKAVFGCGGGLAAYFALGQLNHLPAEASISSFLFLFVIGGFSGAICIVAFVTIRRMSGKS